ncbi:MAG: hypothetical protein RL637_1497 [Pseudomonadota bacterium]
MFTGIILAIGHIKAIENRGGDKRFTINTADLSLKDCQLGDSIAVNGVCLTAIELGDHYFCADVSNETLIRSTFQQARIAQSVNLELALTPNSRLGGHIVSGHVDGMGTIIGKKIDGRSIRLDCEVPLSLAKYIVEKGSICIDGISLTINQVKANQFSVNIVPHTLIKTTLNHAEVGTIVNLEVDLLARYLERLLQPLAKNSDSKISLEFLKNNGFIG